VTVDSITLPSKSFKTSPGTVFRRIAACVVNVICIFLLILGVFLHALNSLVGTSQDAATTFLAIVQAPGAERSIAGTICDDLATNSTSHAEAVINAHHSQCVDAVVVAVKSPKTHVAVRLAFAKAYYLIQHGRHGTIDLAPIVSQVTGTVAAALHIPASELLPGKSFVVTLNPRRAINISSVLTTWAWVAIALGAGGALASALFLVRNKNRQIISVAVTLGTPALFALLLGAGSQSLADAASRYSDTTAKALASHSAKKVGAVFAHYGIWLLVADAVVVLIWLAVRFGRHYNAPAAPSAENENQPAAGGGAAVPG
jgi:hypothetical protein